MRRRRKRWRIIRNNEKKNGWIGIIKRMRGRKKKRKRTDKLKVKKLLRIKVRFKNSIHIKMWWW